MSNLALQPLNSLIKLYFFPLTELDPVHKIIFFELDLKKLLT